MEAKPLRPKEGLFVLHLFYTIDRLVWQNVPLPERQANWDRLQRIIEEAAAADQGQVVTCAMIARADIGFMLLGADLHSLQRIEKQIAASLGAGVLKPVFTFFSLTERSEYTQTEEEYQMELQARGVVPASPDYEGKMEAFRQRIAHYTEARLYPKLPDWEFFAFYPMLKRRDGGDNWYTIPHTLRKKLMLGHAAVGRTYSGRVQQLVTGATGLDDWEWGVTLFAHDPYDVKSIVYEMRFDEVSSRYGGFGAFYTGLVLPLAEIWKRLDLE
ncbi:MAG: chlorite dismutase family protein [Verrucomicrobium sp.]|nr:chlorite dismutase family protein [Verrucomicrobium sp.]